MLIWREIIGLHDFGNTFEIFLVKIGIIYIDNIALANKKCFSQYNPIQSFMWKIRQDDFQIIVKKKKI